MKWKAQILTPRGDTEWVTVDALTRSEATAALGVSASRVKSVQRDLVSQFKASLFSIHLSAFDQATLLSTLSAAAVSGQNPDPVFIDFIRSMRALRRRESEIMALDRLSDRLRLLNVDDQAVVLVETGETTGDLGVALRRAAVELSYRRKLMSRIRTALVMPSLIAIAASAAIIVLPVYFVPMLEEFRQSGIPISGTIATSIIEAIAAFVRAGWFWVLGGFAVAFWYRRAVWSRLHHIAPFTTIDEYVKCLRALSFITLFRPLYEKGIPIEAILRTQVESAGAGTRPVYEQMLEDARSGVAFSRTLDAAHWPKFMRMGLSGFESAVPDAKTAMIDNLTDLMTDRVDALGGRIAGALSALGIALGVLAVILLAFGIYYPMVSATGV